MQSKTQNIVLLVPTLNSRPRFKLISIFLTLFAIFYFTELMYSGGFELSIFSITIIQLNLIGLYDSANFSVRPYGPDG
jgi:hypothetical protein